ncbi:helix-turn-helix transcriptional regulator [Candidatus Enterococcus ikei]|uniref:YafY family transcriptional regulator n=1 Tax=Candidatus Enterococcus ikei TaxID=2815326 RepID=A0ABS3GZN6_9ENTE|nr:YafY family protein [Enterococcus sp. DIV0869a]MBO0440718.1 YafY family transcriptional regulator [Enterococcus sp. DIV0869a]
MNSLSRLFYIMHYLTVHSKVKAIILAEQLEVSIRTIYRDIDTLSSLGFPVYSQNGRDGGIRLLDTHQLSATFVDDDEQDQIMFALQNLAATDLKSFTPLVNKLSSLFNKEVEPWIDIDFSTLGREDEATAIRRITKAKNQKKCIIFFYTNGNGKRTTREVMPNKLIFKQNAWYLVGYCCVRETTRLFKLRRMTELIISENDIDEAYLIKDYQPEFAKIYIEFKIRNELLYRVQEDLLGIEIEQSAEYTKVKSWQVEGTWLISYLLSFGAAVEVMKPSKLKTQIKDEVTKINQIYF